MSRHVRNDQPRHSGPRECGSVAPGSHHHLYRFLSQHHTPGSPDTPDLCFCPQPGLVDPLSSFPLLSEGQEQSSLSEAAAGVACPPHRLLRAVWSLREASYFGRWLIEQDDEAGEALNPVLSYGFGLCSPADFAVSVKRLLGDHQSRSS